MKKTNSIQKLFVLFALSIFLFGCVATKLTTEELVSVKNQKPQDSKALIYIVRPSSYFGAAIKFNVKCDKVPIGSTMGGQFIFASLEPGKHEIVSSAENAAKLFLLAEPNKTYYIEQEVKMGLIVARNKLVRLNDNNGKAALNKCKLSSDCPAYQNHNLTQPYEIKKDTLVKPKMNENPSKVLETKIDTSIKANQSVQNKKSEPLPVESNMQNKNSSIEKLNTADIYYSDKNYYQAFSIYNTYRDDPNFTSEHSNTLGKMYFSGQGTIVNYNLAKDCFEKAAEKGNTKSMYNLGIMYFEGKGVEKDDTKAYEWFKKAADLGNVNAKNNIAEMEKTGFGIRK